MKKQKEFMVMDDRHICNFDELPPVPKEMMDKARKAAREALRARKREP